MLLFCFGAVAHSPSFMGMEIWHVDQLLLFQKVSSVVFGALNDILLSVPAFDLLFASCGTGTMLCPSLLQEAQSLNANPAAPSLSHPFLPCRALSVHPILCQMGAGACTAALGLSAGCTGILCTAETPRCCCIPWCLCDVWEWIFCSGRYCWLLSIRFGSWTDCQGICHCLSPVQESQQDFSNVNYNCNVRHILLLYCFFFFLPPSCLNSVSRVSVKLLDSELFCLCLMDTGDTSCTGRQTSAPACFWSFLCQTACSWQVGAGGYYQNLSNILCLLDNSLPAALQLWYVCLSSSGSL